MQTSLVISEIEKASRITNPIRTNQIIVPLRKCSMRGTGQASQVAQLCRWMPYLVSVAKCILNPNRAIY